MNTRHIKDIKFTKQGFIITLHSGATILSGMNLAEAIEKLDAYVQPMPELSGSYDVTEPLLKESIALKIGA